MSATLQARNIDPCHMRLIGMVGLLGTECWTEKGPCGAGAWNHGGQFGTSAHTSASVPCKCVHNSDPRRNKVSTISPSRVQWYDAVFYPRCGGQLRFFFLLSFCFSHRIYPFLSLSCHTDSCVLGLATTINPSCSNSIWLLELLMAKD